MPNFCKTTIVLWIYEDLMMKKHFHFDIEQQSRIIEMAWEDMTPFESIASQFGIDESALMRLMQSWLKPGSYRLWRKRVKTRSSKHLSKRSHKVTRAYATQHVKIHR